MPKLTPDIVLQAYRAGEFFPMAQERRGKADRLVRSVTRRCLLGRNAAPCRRAILKTLPL